MAAVFKLENGLCRCCHSEGFFKDLGACFSYEGDDKIYADMLKDCFDLNITRMDGEHSQVTYSICETCIIKLEDAYNFKKQVIANEVMFQEIYNVQVVSALQPFPIKIEYTEVEDKSKEFDDNMGDMHDFDDDFEYPESEDDEKTLQEFKVDQQTPKGKGKAKATKVETKPKKTTTVKKKKGEAEAASSAPTRKGKERFSLAEHLNQRDGNYQCNMCDKPFLSPSGLSRHLRLNHFNIDPHPCTLCQLRFKSVCALDGHVREEHGGQYNCTSCNKEYANRRRLKEHYNNFHKMGKIYKCTECDYESHSGRNFRDHKLKHVTERNHKCTYCHKAFSRPKYLAQHERIHENDKREACQFCDAAFVLKSGLYYHVRKFHPSQV